MLSVYQRLRDKSHFIPGISGMFLNPVYLMRRTLADSIRSTASEISGVLLDFGCGSRPYECLFTVEKYIGLDIEVSGHPDECKKADIYYDGKHIPLPDGSVDNVFSAEVFEHVFNAPELFKEIHRVLKPGGRLILTCPFVWPLHEQPYDFARYTPFALKTMLETAGYQSVRTVSSGHPVEVIAQLHLVYLNQLFGNSIPILGAILKIALCTLFNVPARILSHFLPNDGTLYLNNLAIATKVTGS
jgi:SAM-dependent methyltransferase